MPSACCETSELAQSAVSRQEISMNKKCNLNAKPQASVTKSNTELNMLSSTENRAKSINTDCEERRSSLSFGSTSDPDFETFCEPKEQHLEENQLMALPYRNINSQSPEGNNDLDDGQAVCFSQALEDYTKHSQMLGNLHNSVNDLSTNSAFTPNMEALPTIVTFDVVDMHNEGEYDEQIHMELEEDISSPYQEFEESYLQKDAFAECDYQILDLYEHNLISNTWAVASLPRHLGLTRVSQSIPSPLSLDRRSRSLDRESLELEMSDTYRENRAAVISCPQTKRDSSPHYQKNVLMSASWQTRSEMALGLPLTDGESTEKVQRLSQTQVKPKMSCASSSNDFQNAKKHLCSNVSEMASSDLMSQNIDHYKRQCLPPLQSDACSPRGTFVYSVTMEDVSNDIDHDVFCKAATNSPSYNQFGKSRSVASREGISHCGSPVNTVMSKDEIVVFNEKKNNQGSHMQCSLQQTTRGNL